MRLRPSIAATLLLCAASAFGFAQSSGTCAAPPSIPFGSDGLLSIDSRSGEIVVVGSDKPNVRISCTLDRQDRAGEVQISVIGGAGSIKLHIAGGPQNNVHIRIEVPERTDLKLRAPAGEVRVTGVTGNKDLRIYAGEIIVSPVSSQIYGSVQASVAIGDVSAPGLGPARDGFFPAISNAGLKGIYHLTVHVTTGTIQLQGK